MSIFRSRRSWTHDDEEGGWSTWSSGKDMGTSTIVGNLLRISRNVLRCYSSSTREQDRPQCNLD